MDPNPPALRVVIVEDNASLADIYKTRLEAIGYEVYVAYDGEQALYLIEKALPNLVLLDLMVPKIAGDQILARMRASEWGKDIKVLIVSNLNEADAPAGLRQQGIEGYAVKANLSNDQLDDLVNRILKPEGQTEDVSLEKPDEPAVTVQPVVPMPVAPAPASPDVPLTTPEAPAPPPQAPQA
ncbi:MAG TPA: response regulator [Candidatus Saccharimonadales bacterium]|nr:response regulator [Candidatus Saccharimonadales bacterium]